jgi:cytochrome P450
MRSLPKGPRSRILQSYRYRKDAYELFSACRQKYGDPFLLQMIGMTGVVTGDPEGVRDILTARSDTFEPGHATGLMPILGANSVFTVSGERHDRQRHILLPMFQGAPLQLYGERMRAIALQTVEQLKPNTVVTGWTLARQITLRILIETLFGVSDPEEFRILEKAILDLIESYIPLLMLSS